MSGIRLRSIIVTLFLAAATLSAFSPAVGQDATRLAATTQVGTGQTGTAKAGTTKTGAARAGAAQAGQGQKSATAEPSARKRRKCWPRKHRSNRPARLHKHRHCKRPKTRPAPTPAPAPAPVPTPVQTPAPTPAPPSDSWTFVTGDEFGTSGLDTTKWEPFNGRPGCCPDAFWDPSQVEVSDGTLKLHTSMKNGRWVSGGVGGWDWDQGARTYGRYDARIRFDAGKGVSAAALLWPSDNVWPPEIDFYEIAETWGDREKMMMTTHWGTPSDHRLSQRFVDGDFTQWHTASVRWSADEIVYLLDGQVMKVETDKVRIPDTLMWVGLQTHAHKIDGAWPTLPAGKSSIALEVDWVRIYQQG
ncbi:glycoside hydrolase family 16 protein [Nocardioides pacificus]